MSNTKYSVQVECVGNPEFYYDDSNDELEREAMRCDNNKIKVYTFDKLPGKVAFFNIKSGELECYLQYGIDGLTHKQLIRFVDAIKNNGNDFLYFRPGSNQESRICTKDGVISFESSGAGGKCPIDMTIKVPNQYCLDAFEKLLPQT